MKFCFLIDPVPCPRMTQADKWSKRPAVTKYFAFRNELKYIAHLQGLSIVPSTLEAITFALPMPQSWSNKKRLEMNGQAHTQRPDLDNLLKAFLDGLCPEDSHVHSIGKLSKVWAEKGSISLSLVKENECPQSLFYVQSKLY